MPLVGQRQRRSTTRSKCPEPSGPFPAGSWRMWAKEAPTSTPWSPTAGEEGWELLVKVTARDTEREPLLGPHRIFPYHVSRAPHDNTGSQEEKLRGSDPI